jgi:hypothetical protein
MVEVSNKQAYVTNDGISCWIVNGCYASSLPVLQAKPLSVRYKDQSVNSVY